MKSIAENRLRQCWAAGRPVVNGWLGLANGFAAELMGQAGFDSLTIDLQHGLVDESALLPMLQAIAATEAAPVVRVPWLEPGILMKALDAGACGLVCPMVNTREDAQKLVAWTHYAPMGTRSFGPIRAGLVHGADYAREANDGIVVFAMIETAQALDNLDAILSVEGLDAVYIGPSDLSLSLGCQPVFDDLEPRAQQAIEHVLARAQAHGVVAGIHCGRTDVALARAALGFRFVTAAADTRLLAAGAQQVMTAMKAAMKAAPGGR